MNFKHLKKRDKFWIEQLGFISFVFLIFMIPVFFHLLFFNNSYLKEEKNELNIFSKQLEWAISPMIKNKDFNKIKKYCLDFENEDYRFRIFDKNKNLIATSKPNEKEPIFNDDKDFKIKFRPNQKRKIAHIKKVFVDNDYYYFEIVISEEDAFKSIIKAQKTIFILLSLFVIFMILAFYYVFDKIKTPFDLLEDSIIKIANGELDTPIDIQKQDILLELTIAIRQMAKQLKNQITKLKQFEEYKNDFLQNITHEIKTPITAINMAMELIENNKNNTSQNKECLDIISFQINYINSLVNDILTLTELEEDKAKQDKNFNNFNLNETIKEVINYNKFSNIEINFIENCNVDLFGDKGLISRAILNILSNAYRYSKSDKIDIILNKDDDFSILEIKDYGIGIEPEYQKKIFDKFYRIDKSRSRQQGGSGLGLAIVKNIIDLHNGSIELKSNINEGCNFIIKLKLK